MRALQPLLRSVILVLLVGASSACGDGEGTTTGGGSPFDPPRPAATRDLSPAPPMLGTQGRPASSHGAAPEAPRCLAPSLRAASPIDARTESALGSCVRVRTGQERLKCGEDGRALADAKRLEEAIPPLDDRTRARILEVARRGRELGRNPKAFGLVGDSITVSRDFMGALSEKRDRPLKLDDFATRLLQLRSGESVIERFRGEVAERCDGDELDSFAAFRCAKIGASADYATRGAPDSPIAELLRRVNPSIAVVTFGANDAAAKSGSPEVLADTFEDGILSAVSALEQAGVVVILSNEMRHGDQPGVKACRPKTRAGTTGAWPSRRTRRARAPPRSRAARDCRSSTFVTRSTARRTTASARTASTSPRTGRARAS